MYNTIINMISKELEKENKFLVITLSVKVFILLMYIKYLCDKKVKGFNYDEIIKADNINDTLEKIKNYKNLPIKKASIEYLQKHLNDTKINKILGTLKYENSNYLINDFLEKRRNKNIPALEAFINENDKIAYLNLSSKYEYYDTRKTSVTYIDKPETLLVDRNYEYFKLLDAILELKRKYTKDLDLTQYDVIKIIDDSPIYRNTKEKTILELISELLRVNHTFNGKIILKIKYKKISKITSNFILKNLLSKIIFFEDTKNPDVIMEFNLKEKQDISLILLDEKMENNEEKIKKLLETNKRKKGVLIKIKPDDIINNNFRIGFKMYTLENTTEIKKINEIIDENTRLINEVESINKNVEAEINKLIVK